MYTRAKRRYIKAGPAGPALTAGSPAAAQRGRGAHEKQCDIYIYIYILNYHILNMFIYYIYIYIYYAHINIFIYHVLQTVKLLISYMKILKIPEHTNINKLIKTKLVYD